MAVHWPAFGQQGKDGDHHPPGAAAPGRRAGGPQPGRGRCGDDPVGTVGPGHRAGPPDTGRRPGRRITSSASGSSSASWCGGSAACRSTGSWPTEVLEPLGLRRHLPRPARPALAPGVPVRATGRNGRVKQLVFNRRATRRAVIPAAGLSTTARDLARFYQAMLEPVGPARPVSSTRRRWPRPASRPMRTNATGSSASRSGGPTGSSSAGPISVRLPPAAGRWGGTVRR